MNNECGVPTVITKAFESCKRKEETRATKKIDNTGKESEREREYSIRALGLHNEPPPHLLSEILFTVSKPLQ